MYFCEVETCIRLYDYFKENLIHCLKYPNIIDLVCLTELDDFNSTNLESQTTSIANENYITFI